MAGPWDDYATAPPATPPATPRPWEEYGTAPGVDPNNQPPPGVIIHDTNRSYVTGPGGQSVDTTNMSQEDRQTAAAALAMRQRGEVPGSRLVPRVERPAFNAFTLGFGDEAISAGAGLGQWFKGGSFGDTYRTTQEAQRQELEQERAEHPYRSTGTSVAGGLLSGLGLARAVPAVAATAPLATRIAGGAGTGAGYGATQGFGEGSGFWDRLKGSAVGGGLGAAAGAIAAPLADLGSSAYKYLADRISVGRNLGDLGLGRRAADNLLRAGEADDAFLGTGAASIRNAGPNAMVADAGPTYRGLLDMVTQRTGRATREANLAVGDRMTAANLAFRDSLDTALGAPQGLHSTVREIREASAVARDQAYTKAHNAPMDWAHPRAADLDAALQHIPNGNAIVGKANELQTIWEGGSARQIGRNAQGRIAGYGGVDADGRAIFDQPLDTRQLDYLTRALRQQSVSGETTGALGAATDLSAGYGQAATRIRGIMRDIVPEYGTALDTAADPISQIAAARAGARALSPNVGRDEVELTLRHMSPGERQAYLQAVRGNLDETMASVRYAASRPDYDAKQLGETLGKMNSEQARQKLATMLGDPEQVDRLMTGIGHAASAAELSAAMARNSATFGRQSVAAIDKTLGEPGMVGSFFRGQPIQSGQRGWQRLWGTTPQAELRGRDLSDLQIARALTGPRGPDALEQLQRLTRAYDAGEVNKEAARQFGHQTHAAGGLASYYALPGLLETLGLPSPR
jgi:hypothetical protein